MIVARQKLQAFVGRPSPDDAETALIIQIHEFVERLVKNHLGYEVEESSYTEYLPISGNELSESVLFSGDDQLVQYGGGSDRLFLNELPVRSIVSLYENASAYGMAANFVAGSLRIEGRDFYLHRGGTTISKSGMLVRIGGNWPTSPMSVKVGYAAGYTAAELAKTNIPYAVALAFAASWNECLSLQGSEIGQSAGPMTSEKIGDWSASYEPQSVQQIMGMLTDLPMKVRQLLAPYRKIDLVAV